VRGSLRLPPRPAEVIDRQSPIRFNFEGRDHVGYAGDTISSALWAHGVRRIARSFKYHRPRGDFAFDGTDPNALVQIGDEPNVRAGVRRIEEGMRVESQNAFPSLGVDLLSVNGALHRFLPVGFYYKAFHSKRLWPFYERLLRRAGGLGRVVAHEPSTRYEKVFKHADVVVVGGGPSGLSAALAAAESGARVLLLERGSRLGGRLCYEPGTHKGRPLDELADGLVHRAQDHERITVLCETVGFGLYQGHWTLAFGADRLYKIRAQATVVATGALDHVPVFDHNDRPGVLTGSAAARLLNLYAVAPGRQIVMASAHDEGLHLALALREAGCAVAVADERAAHESATVEALAQAGVEIHWEHAPAAVCGRGRVGGVALHHTPQSEAARGPLLDADALVLCTGFVPHAGLLYQGGARFSWHERLRTMRPVALPQGLFPAGRAGGVRGLATGLLDGTLAGRRAAAAAGCGPGPTQDELDRLDALAEGGKPALTQHVSVPGRSPFRFVDFAEDVTEKDVRCALAEGYDQIELLKRYATISMGPDQGRYSSLNSVLLTAKLKGQSVNETGTTTARPPALPVRMGALAGRRYEPVRRTPLHAWHARYGCRWVDAGHWKRPDTYAHHTPAQEVETVRNRVGIVDVSTLGKLLLRGPDVPELLSRLYTNKWRKLPVGQVRYGVMCNEAGAIAADGVTAHLDEETYYMSTTTAHSGAIPEAMRWWLEQPGWDLNVYAVNLTAAFGAINVAGPRARELVSRLTEGEDLSNARLPFMGARRCRLAGVDTLLMRIGYTGELSYEVHVPAGYTEHVWTSLLEAGSDLGILPFGMEAMGILRLEKGHLIVGHDTDPASTPLETELAWTVKFDKPDFLGRAALLRQRERGLTQALVGFEMADGPTPHEGHLVVEDDGRELRRTGWVCSARFSPTLNRAIGFAWVPPDHRTPGTTLSIRVGGRLQQARVVELPFYDPAGERMRS